MIFKYIIKDEILNHANAYFVMDISGIITMYVIAILFFFLNKYVEISRNISKTEKKEKKLFKISFFI